MNAHSPSQKNKREASWVTRRRRIAQAAEAACHLPENVNDPDFEEFAFKYGTSKKSDFA